MRSKGWKFAMGALLLSISGCDQGCAGGEEASSESEGPQGSVARAEALTAEQTTEDGLRVISSMRREPAAPEEDTRNLTREPTSPDPRGGEFSLDDAVEGMPTDGQLVAEIRTSLGTIFCDLHAEEVPRTVAHFIGLARGLRPWWDARAARWREVPAYSDTTFHRVIPDAFIQGGDYLGDGTGTIGFSIDDEPHPNFVHDRAGQLCMASTGVNQNGAQFFITDGRNPELDEDTQFTVFGQCRNEDIIQAVARVPQNSENRPRTDVTLDRIIIRRVTGGAAEARISPPRMPEGAEPERWGLEASPGPSELDNPHGRTFDPSMWTGMQQVRE